MVDLKELNQLNASFASLKPAMLTGSPCGFHKKHKNMLYVL